ncbi:hypothetical protein HPB51_018247 [Rhipicephalus microplus]|uniref:E3 ubiquitin-protein ligase HECW1/2 N-terminal domain-containing protein n=1 Tax=Rhipicephalus microplus TaxID=6941 RepID=A0A9J6D690_RHIMP|nr:hypothetical protein HPB51_018247 [Rhipicephalus microplus]
MSDGFQIWRTERSRENEHATRRANALFRRSSLSRAFSRLCGLALNLWQTRVPEEAPVFVAAAAHAGDHRGRRGPAGMIASPPVHGLRLGGTQQQPPVPRRRSSSPPPPPAPAEAAPGVPPRRLPALQGRSSLSVSRTRFVLAPGEPPLLVSWDIREEVSPDDWIGLYRTDETDPLRFLEHKNKRCPSNTAKGQVLWNIDCKDAFLEETTNVCFRYYHGTSGTLRAVSPVVTICRSADTTGIMTFNFLVLKYYSETCATNPANSVFAEASRRKVRKKSP